MNPNQSFLQNIYDAFNQREIETILSLMSEDVKWANGMEGGFVYGRENVREYWRRQFETISPKLELLESKVDKINRAVATVHQIVEDTNGNFLFAKTVKHIFTFEDGLIKSFEIGAIE